MCSERFVKLRRGTLERSGCAMARNSVVSMYGIEKRSREPNLRSALAK